MEKLCKNKLFFVSAALLVCALWGSLYAFIKLGYSAFGVRAGDIPSVLLFAGSRFIISGAVMVAAVSVKERKISPPTGKRLVYSVVTGTLSVAFHYALTYIALSLTSAGKVAVIKQVGFLLLPCFAFLFRKEDKLSHCKIIGAVLGFAAIVVINLEGMSFAFSLGDWLVLAASFCTAASTVVAKKAYESCSPGHILAYGQLWGGILLAASGAFCGGSVSPAGLSSFGVLTYICFASVLSYMLWENLLKYNEMSRMSVIKSWEPIFAMLFSAMLMQENIMRPENVIAVVMVIAAVIIAER